eukprot:TRINITY_DN45980_c1_g2_i1.p1 TRINITY_DN45980_c1_g2~~TRINITY_DN45980_c1_g2_i1.p1  ORF type:complete len:123 (-),score=4.53 TRINITY_DN45980_c1_g2_i1:55-423(-)
MIWLDYYYYYNTLILISQASNTKVKLGVGFDAKNRQSILIQDFKFTQQQQQQQLKSFVIIHINIQSKGTIINNNSNKKKVILDSPPRTDTLNVLLCILQQMMANPKGTEGSTHRPVYPQTLK